MRLKKSVQSRRVRPSPPDLYWSELEPNPSRNHIQILVTQRPAPALIKTLLEAGDLAFSYVARHSTTEPYASLRSLSLTLDGYHLIFRPGSTLHRVDQPVRTMF